MLNRKEIDRKALAVSKCFFVIENRMEEITMKQLETVQKAISGNTFFIMKFGAFKAANLSGKLIGLIAPVMASLMPLVGKDVSMLDQNIENVVPLIAGAFSQLEGNKVEVLLKELLLGGNISVQLEGETDVKRLTEDVVNEIFCGDVQDMFLLAGEVVRVNYQGFFKKMQSQFGIQNELLTKVQKMTSTVSSTPHNSAN